jgi:hypothetical protein
MSRVIGGLPETWGMLKVVLRTQFARLTEEELLSMLTAEEENIREEAQGSAMWSQGEHGRQQGGYGRGRGRGRSPFAGRGQYRSSPSPARGNQGQGRGYGGARGAGRQGQQGGYNPFNPARWGKMGLAPKDHCHGCHKPNHTWQMCRFRPKGAVPDCVKEMGTWQPRGEAAAVDEQLEQEYPMFGEISVVGSVAMAATVTRDGWWMDSGASHHFTYCSTDFCTKIREPEVRQVRIGNGALVDVKGMGK